MTHEPFAQEAAAGRLPVVWGDGWMQWGLVLLLALLCAVAPVRAGDAPLALRD